MNEKFTRSLRMFLVLQCLLLLALFTMLSFFVHICLNMLIFVICVVFCIYCCCFTSTSVAPLNQVVIVNEKWFTTDSPVRIKFIYLPHSPFPGQLIPMYLKSTPFVTSGLCSFTIPPVFLHMVQYLLLDLENI